jgi:PKD repeat protein
MVTDGCENTGSETLAVIVSVPTGPTAVISPSSTINITACSDSSYTYEFNAYDSESNASCEDLTYAWSVSGSPGTAEPSDTDDEVTFSCTFSDWGTYEVTLLVTDVCGSSDDDSVTVNVSDCCLAASFTYSPTAPVNTGDVITFNASTSSADCGCGVVTYEWDWDYVEGSFAVEGSGQITTHAYDLVGTHTVALLVTDACGQTAMATMDVVVVAPAPAQASILITSIDDKTVEVSGENSTSGCLPIVSYDWNWNDTTDNGTGVTSIHTYDTYDSITISLTVTDYCGDTDIATVTFELVEDEPVAVINVISIDGLAVNVSAENSTYPEKVTSYHWIWGEDSDENTYTGATAGHTYNDDDNSPYTITLELIDADGTTVLSTATATVNVSEPAPPVPPVAAISILSIEDGAGTTKIVNVSGMNSTTSCFGGITAYEWNWDYVSNPTNFTGVGGTSANTYSGGTGLVTIALRVTDACYSGGTGYSTVSTAQVYIP